MLGTICDTMADGLFTVDLDGTITFWNKGAERITGFAVEDVIGKNCDILEGDNCLGTDCVDGIRLGSTLPAFLSPTVVNILVEKFDIKPIGTAQEDIEAMMAGE